VGKMIKVSDYIAKVLAEDENVSDTVFMVSGGGNMHLINAVGKHAKLNYICNHHEQACTIAAEGYARLSNKIGVAYVTTGPGGTNAISGVYGAWVDSIPTLTISGQVKLETTIASEPNLSLRQLGDQEINIIDLVKPITKYAVMIIDKNSIKYHLQKALYEAKNERPGPVWLDIPLDIQASYIDENTLVGFYPDSIHTYDTKIEQVFNLISKASRPVIVAGNGIALSGARKSFKNLISKLKIPVLSSFARYDILNDDSPYMLGRFGTIGHRSSNFIIQNSDLVISIGARLNIRSISYNWDFFAREAIKVSVDIDSAELDKHTLKIDLKIKSDAKIFIDEFYKKLQNNQLPSFDDWLLRCAKYRDDFPLLTADKILDKNYVNSYNFFSVLSNISHKKEVFVFANATASVSSYQCLTTKDEQRVIENSGSAAMGYDLPASIGACVANNKESIVCVTGEGSLQMNIQELQTIKHNKLLIKLFVLNNNGYSSIKNTQSNFFDGFKVGSDASSGVSFPSLGKLAYLYDFKFFKITNQNDLENELNSIYNTKEAFICEVLLDANEKMEPKLSSELRRDGTMVSKPLEDMYPFLDRKIFKQNMIIEPLEE